jgi:hydroxyisourate hydrolase
MLEPGSLDLSCGHAVGRARSRANVTGYLTTHVLDTAYGTPAAGVTVTLVRVRDGALLATAKTNADGRTDGPLLEGAAFAAETYDLSFDVGAYFAGRPGVADPPYLATVVVRFTVAHDDEHYHVPLLVAPWGYSTYRGT